MTTPATASQNLPTLQVNEMLDVLYEILASGLEPESATVSSHEIEVFLHQHARAPKTAQEVEAFFRAGGLPLQLDALSRDSGLRLAAVTMSTPSASDGETRAPETTGRHRVELPTGDTQPRVQAQVISTQRASDSWQRPFGLGLAAVMVAMAIACFAGGWFLLSLRDELARAHSHEQVLEMTVQQLQQRLAQLDKQQTQQSAVLEATRVEVERVSQMFMPSQP